MATKSMSLTQSVLITSGVLLAAAVTAALIAKFASSDPPIYVGDGSITIQFDGTIKQNSTTEIEPRRFWHKVKSIAVGDKGQAPGTPYDVTDRQWTLTSASPADFQLNLRPHWLGLENGVPATCGTGWSGSSSLFTCAPGSGQLTPATLTYLDGNCINGQPACPQLTCPSKICTITLTYK
jgi:hypothetical protein